MRVHNRVTELTAALIIYDPRYVAIKKNAIMDTKRQRQICPARKPIERIGYILDTHLADKENTAAKTNLKPSKETSYMYGVPFGSILGINGREILRMHCVW